MSIAILIDRCLSRGELFSLHPLDYSKPIRRILYLSKAVNEFVNDESDYRAGKLLAELESFVAGEKILVTTKPREAYNEKMGLLAPIENGIWDFRSRDPSPGLRLFGGFSKKDCFIVMTKHERWRMSEPEWRAAIRECDENWRALFGTGTSTNLPMYIVGGNPGDYLSNCISLD